MNQRQRSEGGKLEKFLEDVQPGDHIFSGRKKNTYHHHGIYMGESMVIHLRRESSACNYCNKCRYIPPLRCGRVLSCLGCFRANERCHIIRYGKVVPLDEEIRNRLRPGKALQGYHSKQVYLELFLEGELYCHVKISNKESSNYIMEDRFTMSRFTTSKSADEVMKTAFEDGSGFKRYNLLMNNYGDFAVFCKTNEAVSVQVEQWFKTILPGIGRITYRAAKNIYLLSIGIDVRNQPHGRIGDHSFATNNDLNESVQWGGGGGGG